MEIEEEGNGKEWSKKRCKTRSRKEIIEEKEEEKERKRKGMIENV